MIFFTLLIIIGTFTSFFFAAKVWYLDGQIKKLQVEREILLCKRAELTEKMERASSPTCSCGHGYGHHKGAKKCQAYTHDDSGLVAWVLRADRCTCTVYTGPEPLPEYYHPLELK